MIFNALLPVDSDPAMDIDIYIRDLKESVYERLRCTNSDGVDEHQDGDDLGAHEPSLVSFIQIFDTVLEYENASKIPDGLYYVRATELLYSSTGPLTTSDHDNLLGRSEVDAHDFYHVGDDSREHQVNLTLEAASNFSQSDANTTPPNYGLPDTAPIPASHTTSTWVDAHGAGTFDTAWISPRTLSGIPNINEIDGNSKRLRVTQLSGGTTRDYFMTPNDFLFMPCLRMAHKTDGGWGGSTIVYFKPWSGANQDPRIRCYSHDSGVPDNYFRVFRLSRAWAGAV